MSIESYTHKKAESPQETIERFISLTKKPFREDVIDAESWDYEMDKLYGNPEVARITKDDNLAGPRDIREKLEAAFAADGLNGLKFEFLNTVLVNPEIIKFGPAIIPAIRRIINFS